MGFWDVLGMGDLLRTALILRREDPRVFGFPPLQAGWTTQPLLYRIDLTWILKWAYNLQDPTS
jgi:hypothetical protein